MIRYIKGKEDQRTVICSLCATAIRPIQDCWVYGEVAHIQESFICTDCAPTEEEAETLHSVKFLL